jgi:periplasmic protein TonB
MSAMSIGETRAPAENHACFANPNTHGRAFIYWSFCAAVVILVHGLIGSLMLRWQTEAAAIEPTATIVIELSPLVTAPAVRDAQIPPVPEQMDAQTPSEKVVEQDIEEEQKVVEEPFERRLEMIEPKLEMEPLPARRAVDIERAGPSTQDVPILAIDEKSEVELTRLPEVDKAKQADAPRPAPVNDKPREQKVQLRPNKAAPNRPQKQAPNRTATKPQRAQAREATSFQAPAVSAPSDSDALPNWRSQIVGILERNKRFPPEAEAHQDHGVSNLAFSLNRQGRVISARIAGSSGSPALDAETLALVHRVQPFPPPPPEVAGAQINLVVAIRYNPRHM